MLKIHRDGLRDLTLSPEADEIEITDGFVVDISRVSSEVVLTAAKDLQDYLLISMGVSVLLDTKGSIVGSGKISVDIAPDKLTLGKGYMGYKLSFDEGIKIDAFDERGIAQAFYFLEDMMTFRSAPFIKKEVIENKATYSPRMIHSGFGIDQFPDCHLRAIAHSGMDAILVFTKEVNTTTCGFLDFNELIVRAAKYGIDVYAYSYMKSTYHPLDEGADEYYESTYGRLFEKCPGLKGVVLVGESVGFPTRDEYVVNSKTVSSRFWPCTDYPQWLEFIKNKIRRYNKNADIVLWSYNWGWAPEKNRVELIKNMPKDVSLLATFEMHESYKRDGVTERSADYTLSLTGPGGYFLSEAKAAKENGIRLYSMVNTGGLTWDFGTIPYEPFPYQWKIRYDNMKKCHEEYGLCGLMESHHYGFYPSFISRYAKYCFTKSTKEKDYLKDILASEFGRDNVETVDEALRIWSESIKYMIAVAADQYGGLRIGPGYPLCLWGEQVPPCAPHAHFGSRKSVLFVDYLGYGRTGHTDISMPQVRMPYETDSFKKMRDLMSDGIGMLESIENKNDALEELIDLGKYIRCCLETTINAKLFHTEKVKFYAETEPAEMKKRIDRMEEIALAEIENTKSAIPLVRMNSRLGWEPSMEYLADEEHLNWKIAQVKNMLAVDLQEFKDTLKNDI